MATLGAAGQALLVPLLATYSFHLSEGTVLMEAGHAADRLEQVRQTRQTCDLAMTFRLDLRAERQWSQQLVKSLARVVWSLMAVAVDRPRQTARSSDRAAARSLRAILVELQSISAALEQPRRPPTLTRADRTRLALALPAIAGAVGSECFASRDLLAHASPAVQLVVRGCTAKQLGRLLRRAEGPADRRVAGGAGRCRAGRYCCGKFPRADGCGSVCGPRVRAYADLPLQQQQPPQSSL